MSRQYGLLIVGVVLVAGLAGCPKMNEAEVAACIAAAGKYDVKILRDTWGVPHVFGKTDADTAYGLGYAHSEDDFATIQEVLLATRGMLASVKGMSSAPIDYMAHMMRAREVVDEKYETDISPEVRAVCEAYADGVNHYAALHLDEAVRNLFPVTGKDVVVEFVIVSPMFFGLDSTVKGLFEDKRQEEVTVKKAATATAQSPAKRVPMGSNTFAVGPRRSADGKTRININSHQPLTGPVAWYEAHLHSEEGWDCVGGLFPGSPIILHGHNRHLGWAHTVNRPDLVDIYVLDINPENPNQYKFDGEWRDLEVGTVKLKVRVFGPLRWTVERELLWSVHGPVVRRPHGTYAIRYGGMGEIRQVEQWYRMNKAKNFDEWMDAVRIRGLSSFNIGYADREGNIYYAYNARLPIRAEGYDWKKYLPGDISETLWTEYLPFEKLPQVLNPPSGFIQNCNNCPFHTTTGEGNPNPDDYSDALGIETLMTNRALRALELLGGDESITEEEFYAYKFDVAYSEKSPIPGVRQAILDATPADDPVVKEALDVFRAWDLRTDKGNTGAAIAITTLEPIVRAVYFDREPPDYVKTFTKNAHKLHEAFGRIDVPWAEVNRLRRGGLDLGLSGGPDTLRAAYGHMGEDGRLWVHSGDCYILIATFDENGVTSQSIHQFGAATLDETSQHYADQMPLFVECKMKPVWLDEADIRANLEREYRPGEEMVQ